MPSPEHHSHFCGNLRLLCTYYRSVADVCRRLEINRAQFNRYLNGSSRPSTHTLNRLCHFFHVEPAVMHLPPERFREHLQRRPARQGRPSGFDRHLSRLHLASEGRLAKYLGHYFHYHWPPAYPGRVVRSLLRLYDDHDEVHHERIERLPRHASFDAPCCRRYMGAAFFLQDRLFLMNYESRTESEIAHTILFPTYRARVARLHGLMLGVSLDARRAVACSRVALEYLGQEINRKRALRACGLFTPEDLLAEQVDPQLLRAIEPSGPADPAYCSMPSF